MRSTHAILVSLLLLAGLIGGIAGGTHGADQAVLDEGVIFDDENTHGERKVAVSRTG